ncbi:hypothetical protein ACLOJK_040705 [Asimina triloba]
MSGSSSSIPIEIPQADPAAAVTINYSVALTIGVLLLIVSSLTFLSYYCTRSGPRPSRTRQLNSATSPPPPSSSSGGGGGIDEATLSSCPKLLYSKAKLQSKVQGEESYSSSCWASCSICLADYKDAEMLRMLPECGHLFHVKCIDAWLRLHPTCPVCRTSPLPTPLSTPLYETLPLASRA